METTNWGAVGANLQLEIIKVGRRLETVVNMM